MVATRNAGCSQVSLIGQPSANSTLRVPSRRALILSPRDPPRTGNSGATPACLVSSRLFHLPFRHPPYLHLCMLRNSSTSARKKENTQISDLQQNFFSGEFEGVHAFFVSCTCRLQVTQWGWIRQVTGARELNFLHWKAAAA